MENYELRHFGIEDWQSYKKIRLEALFSTPEVFGSNYQKESAYSDEEWIALLENPKCAMFGLMQTNFCSFLDCIAGRDPLWQIYVAHSFQFPQLRSHPGSIEKSLILPVQFLQI